MTFLSDSVMNGADWRALERAIARVMLLAGWKNIAVVGASGDNGADIVGIRTEHGKSKTWVVQVKSVVRGKYVGVNAIKEIMNALSLYNAQVAVVATNGDFYDSARKRQLELTQNGFELKLWNGKFLLSLLDKLPNTPLQKTLRPYQQEIVYKAQNIYLENGKRVFFIVATGLGKTVIAARLTKFLWEQGNRKILVLCHAQDLALQLEQSFWNELPKEVATRTFFGGIPPIVYDGINFGLYQTFLSYLNGISVKDFDVVIVDEAHHALATGFRTCLNYLKPRFLIGMTATPWRGDGKSIIDVFGEPIAKVSLVDGMSQGFLAQVDYRLFCDNIDWETVNSLSSQRLGVKDLNRKLFLPQRDEAIISVIKNVANEQISPKIIVFSPTIEHGRRMAAQLTADGLMCVSLSGENKFERRKRLLDFEAGKYIAVTSVDLLNEGIDVPDVNILVFMRATHSRRIFVQQLGRGLRVHEGKSKVIVLDFITDIRRISDVIQLDMEGRVKGNGIETVYMRDGVVRFSNIKAQSFMSAWLADVADVGGYNDTEILSFPEVF